MTNARANFHLRRQPDAGRPLPLRLRAIGKFLLPLVLVIAPLAHSQTNTPAGTTKTNAPTATPGTNSAPHFLVQGYEVVGNTLLSEDRLDSIFMKYTGTNITISDINAALAELKLEYLNRGFPTVKPVLPQQTLTNGIVRVQVLEGRVTEIIVSKNRYFSSNNVMRALPGLKTNTILNSTLFQAELDRANANRDRQIYPEMRPGPEPDTTSLILGVKDQLPVHGKSELNNQSSPGTPELRVNSSAVYDNLWQWEHSLGAQYSFSPEQFKHGDQWNFYDEPLVANYSGFYRMPIGSPEAIEDLITARPGTFGYDEATRKFRLPPPSGLPELNVYASRSTIDTGLEMPSPEVLLQTPDRTVTKGTSQEDITINEDLGFRFTQPLPEFDGIRSTVSAGLDYKTYRINSDKTYIYTFIEILHHTPGDVGTPVVGTLLSPLPTTEHALYYLPLNIRWDASRTDSQGRFDFGFGYTANPFGGIGSSTSEDFEEVAGSEKGTGYYQILNSSLTRDQLLFRHGVSEWRLVLHAEGQWANQPLISNEQFGNGGVASIRGYREGEVFGDTGWRISGEIKTPPHVVGLVAGPSTPLTVRGSLFMDYGTTYLLDPQGATPNTSLWGAGVGFVGTIGTHWEARFIFGWPLLNTPTTEAGQPRVSFGINGQF